MDNGKSATTTAVILSLHMRFRYVRQRFCVTLLATLLTSVDYEAYTSKDIVSAVWIMKILQVFVCFYLEGSLMFSVKYHIKKVQTEFPIFLPFDLFMVSLLFSSATLTLMQAREDIYTIGYPILLTYLGFFLFLWFMYVAGKQLQPK